DSKNLGAGRVEEYPGSIVGRRPRLRRRQTAGYAGTEVSQKRRTRLASKYDQVVYNSAVPGPYLDLLDPFVLVELRGDPNELILDSTRGRDLDGLRHFDDGIRSADSPAFRQLHR